MNPSELPRGDAERPAAFLAELSWCDGAVTFTVHGELDIATGPLLTALVEHAVRVGQAPVVTLDLSGVRFFGAEGVGALLSIRESAQTRGCRLVLSHVAGMVREVLQLTGALGLFEVATSAGAEVARPRTAIVARSSGPTAAALAGGLR